jgi:hypothetical protein
MVRSGYHPTGYQRSTGLTLWSVGMLWRAAGGSLSHDRRAVAEGVMVNVGGPCGEGCSPPNESHGRRRRHRYSNVSFDFSRMLDIVHKSSIEILRREVGEGL